MKLLTLLSLSLALLLAAGCGGHSHSGDHTHSHDGESHSHGEAEAGESAAGDEEDHDHDDVPLGTVKLGELEVELRQGHGGVAAGKESHLVVKLPYSDGGATQVRAWLGTEDRTFSLVGKAEYSDGHDDYDLHATAPDPLPEPTLWWVELEQPDGTKLLGSVKPILE